MMLWETLGLLSVLALWGACGLLPWCVALIAAHGRATLVALPMAAIAGMAGGLLVAALTKDGAGFAVSVLVAIASGTLVSILASRSRRKDLVADG